MQRLAAALTDRAFDVVVIGAGMYGACMAWEAVTRGALPGT